MNVDGSMILMYWHRSEINHDGARPLYVYQGT